jgi:hypothetical protein
VGKEKFSDVGEAKMALVTATEEFVDGFANPLFPGQEADAVARLRDMMMATCIRMGSKAKNTEFPAQ